MEDNSGWMIGVDAASGDSFSVDVGIFTPEQLDDAITSLDSTGGFQSQGREIDMKLFPRLFGVE
jgi:hypothetical protein